MSATTLAGPPTSLTLQPSATTITAGNSINLSVKAVDVNGKPCNGVNVEVTSSTGQSWSVPITNGVGTVPGSIALTKPGLVTFEATYGAFVFTADTITVQAASQSNTIWSGYAASPGSGVTAVGATWVAAQSHRLQRRSGRRVGRHRWLR